MQFNELFELQRKLDTYIEETQHVTREVFREKALALLVELAELANETRCFKYWSTKGPSDRATLLEEFVDSIHFMLSLGNMKGYQLKQWPEAKSEEDLTAVFIEANSIVSRFIAEPTEQNYIAIWHVYAKLAYHLQFSLVDMIEAYLMKNEKNYARQKAGY